MGWASSKVKNRLTTKFVEKINNHGHFPDGGGLFLQVQMRAETSPAKSWVVRFRAPNGRMREMGLGTAEYISLAEARTRAFNARQKAALGIDPIEERNTAKAILRAPQQRGMTFQECAEAYIEANRAGWKNAKHGAQWKATLEAYAYPVFGKMDVGDIDQTTVLKALDPIWSTKTETATRVRSRIESVLDWAKVRGYRTGDNPARWKGHLDKALPARSKVKRVSHHAALPYADLPAFVLELSVSETSGARALAFCILTATRTSETLLAQWPEFDLKDGVWTIPPERMKAGREHRVPLAPSALKVIERARMALVATDSPFVFESSLREKKPLSNMTLLMQLRRMDRTDITAHGFRSTFRDWAAETTTYPREVAEAALAHTLTNKVEAAYRRGDLFDKRRSLMNDWAAHVTSSLPNPPNIFPSSR